MSSERTQAAIHAIEDLNSVGFINMILRGRMMDPAPEGADYHPNWRLFQSVEWYLTCREITHAADVLNFYCQALLAEALVHTPSLWDNIKNRFPKEWTREKAIEMLRVQRASDGMIRKILGKDLTTFWNAEMDLISKVRNMIVHQAGIDPGGEIKKAIKRCEKGKTILAPIEHLSGEIPVDVDESGHLLIDAKTGKWATDHVLHNIYMMDQNWMARFNIPGEKWVMKRKSFSMQSSSNPVSLGPGMPLPTNGPEPLPINHPELPEFPDYTDMIPEEEIECAKNWKQTREEICEFIVEYCDQIEARIRAMKPSIPGNFPSNTVKDHEHHVGFEIGADDPDHQGSQVGVRLRQSSLTPYLTIWSDQTMMIDFETCELTDEIKDHLRDCIEKALEG